jgi:hypothetical protein
MHRHVWRTPRILKKQCWMHVRLMLTPVVPKTLMSQLFLVGAVDSHHHLTVQAEDVAVEITRTTLSKELKDEETSVEEGDWMMVRMFLTVRTSHLQAIWG